jgi:hypothetical protein
MRTRIFFLASFLFAAAAFADHGRFEVKPDEFDPGHTHLVQAAWLGGIGCPTNAKIAVSNATGTGVSGFTSFSDPACPPTEDRSGNREDKNVEGLLLAKTGPTANFAAAVARIDGVKGEVITELGWDIRKPGLGSTPPDTSAGARGSHCGAGAPRWNIETRDGFFFLGCNSPPAPVQTPGIGFIRMRWGGSAGTLMAFNTSGVLVPVTGQVKSLEIVFDEGYDTGPDNFGLAVLDNIDVNGVLVGKGPTDADAK